METRNCNRSYVQVTVLFFAKSKELVGESEGFLELPTDATGKEIVDILNETYPRIKELGGCFTLSLNQEYLPHDFQETLRISATDELAVIPPLSGG